MKPLLRVFQIDGWVHDPAKRGHRFRCQGCAKLIADGSDVTIEKRKGGAHGYHRECFIGLNATAALARQAEYMRKRLHHDQ